MYNSDADRYSILLQAARADKAARADRFERETGLTIEAAADFQGIAARWAEVGTYWCDMAVRRNRVRLAVLAWRLAHRHLILAAVSIADEVGYDDVTIRDAIEADAARDRIAEIARQAGR